MSWVVLWECDCHADVILAMYAEQLLQILIKQASTFLAVVKVLHLQQGGLDCPGPRMCKNSNKTCQCLLSAAQAGCAGQHATHAWT